MGWNGIVSMYLRVRAGRWDGTRLAAGRGGIRGGGRARDETRFHHGMRGHEGVEERHLISLSQY
jgi:hypothetical protein